MSDLTEMERATNGQGGTEPDWKKAFSGVLKQRNEWMNRAQNLELDMFLMEERIKDLTAELDTLKQATTSEKVTASKHHKAGSA